MVNSGVCDGGGDVVMVEVVVDVVVCGDLTSSTCGGHYAVQGEAAPFSEHLWQRWLDCDCRRSWRGKRGEEEREGGREEGGREELRERGEGSKG